MADIFSLIDTRIAALVLVVSLGLLLPLIAATRKGPRVSHPEPWRAPAYRSEVRREPVPITDAMRVPAPPVPRPDTSDAALQLNATMAGTYEKRRILNHSEYRVFRIIEEDVAAARKGFRVFAQTCLGEILTSPDDSAFRAINAKRVDMLIVDQGGWPVLAVEYQGPGHYQGNAAARDAIKKEALRKAGVRTVEITESDTEHQVRACVREHLGWPPPAVAAPPRLALAR